MLVLYFHPDFILLSCKLDNFTLNVLYLSIYIDVILKEDKITILSQFHFKNPI